MKINPSAAFYIKLGRGGGYERQCIEVDNTLRVGYTDIPHELCQNGNWEEVKRLLIQETGCIAGTATHHANQLSTFYRADETVLWATFYKNQLWWCFARTVVAPLTDGSRVRDTRDGWKSTSLGGEPLEMGRLSGNLLKMQGYRGTICSVKEFDYLVRKINGEPSPVETAALDAHRSLAQALERIISHLDWKEFEVLTDLIFRQAGWQRVSQLGKTQKTLDLDLRSPIASERYLVQVKSQAGRNQFERFQEETSGMGAYSRFYLIVHTPASSLTKELETATHRLWLPAEIAQLVIRYGLVDWVIDHAI